MENTKEMNRAEMALEILRNEVKNVILNEEAEMEFTPSLAEGYIADLTVKIGCLTVKMSVADRYICYLTEFMSGLFKGEDFEKVRDLTLRRVRGLNKEDFEKIKGLKSQIAELESQIDEIKEGAMV